MLPFIFQPILAEQLRSTGSVQTVTRLNVDNILNCPHDLSHSSEFHDDLPTLLGDMFKQKKIETPEKIKIKETKELKIENTKPLLDIFESIEDSLRKLQKDASDKMKKIKFLGPYERYKMVKPFIQAMEEEKEKEKALLAKERKPERVVEGFVGDKISIDVNDDKSKTNEGTKKKVTQEGTNINIEIKNFTNEELNKKVRCFVLKLSVI